MDTWFWVKGMWLCLIFGVVGSFVLLNVAPSMNPDKFRQCTMIMYSPWIICIVMAIITM